MANFGNADLAQGAPEPARIHSLTIEGFRSLRSIQNLNLPDLAVLIGANGAGDDQFFMGARKTPRIHAELCIKTEKGENDYRFDLAHISAGDTVMVMNEAYRFSPVGHSGKAKWQEIGAVGKESSLLEQKDKTAQTIANLLRQCSTYQFHDTSINAAIHHRWDISDSFRLRSDGGNLAAILLNLRQTDRQRYELIVRQIVRVLPAFKDFVLEEEAGKVLLRWVGRQSDKVFGSHLTSDGSLRLFCLLTLLNLPPDRLPDVMFFDEPELGLHPHAMTLVAEMFKRLSKKRQIFIATQSPYLVDCFELENIIIASADHGETTLRNLPREQYQEWLADEYQLSDIWLKQAVGETG